MVLLFIKILIDPQEVVQEDCGWQDFVIDEVAIKFRVADIILVNLLNDTVSTLKHVSRKRGEVGTPPTLVTPKIEEKSREEKFESSDNIPCDKMTEEQIFDVLEQKVHMTRGSRQRTLSF